MIGHLQHHRRQRAAGRERLHHPGVNGLMVRGVVLLAQHLFPDLSPLAQQRKGFTVGKLPDYGTLNGTPLEEALHDNTRSPVPEQVCFRLDFPRQGVMPGTPRDIGAARDLGSDEMVGQGSDLLGQGTVRHKRRPFMIEAMVGRLYGHSSSSGALRVPDEPDPIRLFEQRLLGLNTGS